jgi:hypothetical protein
LLRASGYLIVERVFHLAVAWTPALAGASTAVLVSLAEERG